MAVTEVTENPGSDAEVDSMDNEEEDEGGEDEEDGHGEEEEFDEEEDEDEDKVSGEGECGHYREAKEENRMKMWMIKKKVGKGLDDRTALPSGEWDCSPAQVDGGSCLQNISTTQ
ncbi:hypothetical protein TREES_T100009592 [Tupaia chinensis]|uniref:Prothymosin alpha n=1 Tax=Tupaia chinensis TaxID=246437 RepID=L9LCC8_TUPCH|nr:hypothetical protein TREES_T100009592 [Tupaia chinensis]